MRRFALAAGFLAPLALLLPWAVVPSHLPGVVAWGGFPFFRGWLTRYPNFGPWNYQVLVGTACEIVLAVAPAAVAIAALLRVRRVARLALAGLAMIAWVPVLVRLDAMLFVTGIFGGGGGPPIPLLVATPSLHAAGVLAAMALAWERDRPATG